MGVPAEVLNRSMLPENLPVAAILALQRKVVSASSAGTVQKRYFRALSGVFRAPNTRGCPDGRALPIYARKRLLQKDLRSERIQHFAL